MIQDISPHQYDVSYRKREVKKGDIMLIYCEGGVLCRMEGSQITYPTAEEVAQVSPDVYREAEFLFRIDEKNYFELRQQKVEAFEAWQYLEIEGLRSARPIWMAYAGITGFQIHKWRCENQYCGYCGGRMQPQGTERAMQCVNCKKLSYPKICPSVIVGILNNNRILLTKYADRHSSYKKYALVAGYVEVGESLEAAVRREVMEEVGLQVKNIRYYKSQPWSFSDTLLVGFFCEVDGDPGVRMDEEELSAAEWFDRDYLPAERSEASISLTGEMIEAFRSGTIV